MKTIVPIVDIPKFRKRGWKIARIIGRPPKDALMEKTDDEREETDPAPLETFRGG